MFVEKQRITDGRYDEAVIPTLVQHAALMHIECTGPGDPPDPNPDTHWYAKFIEGTLGGGGVLKRCAKGKNKQTNKQKVKGLN